MMFICSKITRYEVLFIVALGLFTHVSCQFPNFIVREIGSSINFTCPDDLTNNHTYKFSALKKQATPELITPGARIKLLGPILMIVDLEWDDNGQYFCSIYNSNGNQIGNTKSLAILSLKTADNYEDTADHEQAKPAVMTDLALSVEKVQAVLGSLDCTKATRPDGIPARLLNKTASVTNLLEVLDYTGSELDNGGQVDAIYLDLSKAFDKVSHSRLKHAHGWIWRQLIQWFDSYLTNRQQRVAVLGATSTTLPVTSGGPQGCILGPVLFALYVNDLPDAVKFSQVAMFADDTKLFSIITTENDCEHLQNDLHNLRVWSSESGPSFNDKKCKVQHITRKFTPLTTTYKLSSNLEQIECWSRITSPGTNKFMISWRKQISYWAISLRKVNVIHP
ncbi:RNA-directed DNA polymerase from mobile element jockey [Paramuricea clavata]|uniref:RNA-directed DNA polymerase from mobile element jockey n=1 Tax=Paramuricea clavata TaxID=317549 RepID=A0A7D9HIJ1_PARCT|nr:RNA-directed DNA polymerase from mobile element jockey [Paramuricea clavata]